MPILDLDSSCYIFPCEPLGNVADVLANKHPYGILTGRVQA